MRTHEPLGVNNCLLKERIEQQHEYSDGRAESSKRASGTQVKLILPDDRRYASPDFEGGDKGHSAPRSSTGIIKRLDILQSVAFLTIPQPF